MCGIVAVCRFDEKPAAKMVLKRYRYQKTRGSEGYGYVDVRKNGGFGGYVRATDEEQITEALEENTNPFVIFHHRFPTSTKNIVEAAHPIKVSHPSLKHDYYVIHNGIIWNADDLKSEHSKLGFTYSTTIVTKYVTTVKTYTLPTSAFNDSEALAVELALKIEGKKEAITCRGSIAFIALQVDKGSNKATAMYYGRNSGSPLKLEIASTFFALKSEGHGISLDTDILYRYDVKTGQNSQEKVKIGVHWDASSDNDYGYRYERYNREEEWQETINGLQPVKRIPPVGTPIWPKRTPVDHEHQYDDIFEAEERLLELRQEEASYRGLLLRAEETGDTQKYEEIEALLQSLIEDIADCEIVLYDFARSGRE